MKFWRLLPLVSAPMSFQMALDEILFRRMEFQKETRKPTLRFFKKFAFGNCPKNLCSPFKNFHTFLKENTAILFPHPSIVQMKFNTAQPSFQILYPCLKKFDLARHVLFHNTHPGLRLFQSSFRTLGGFPRIFE